MSENIGVSIICNTYNHEPYIRDALEGFVMQKTDFAFEVLIHDDASTDNTADIIREYEAKYPEIIKPIYQTENQYSQKIPFTNLYQKPRVKGKYVAFCEGDDYWTDPLKLQKQYDFLENNLDYSLCACSTVWLDMKTGKSLNKCQTEMDRDVILEEIIEEKRGRVFQFATVMTRREIYLQEYKWKKPYPGGDIALAIKAALNGKIRMLGDCMAVYRFQAPGSWTSKMKSGQWVINFRNQLNENLEELNEITEYKYDKVIKNKILSNKYEICIINGDLKGMVTGDIAKIYKGRNVKQKINDILRCKLPKAHKIIKKIAGGLIAG